MIVYTAKFYVGEGAKLHAIDVLNEHYLAPGSTEEAYLCREVGSSREFVADKNKYKNSPEEAYAELRNEFLQGVINAENEIERLKARISRYSDMLKMIP